MTSYSFNDIFNQPKGLGWLGHVGLFIVFYISFYVFLFIGQGSTLVMNVWFISVIVIYIAIRRSKKVTREEREIFNLVSEVLISNNIFTKIDDIKRSPSILYEEDENKIYITINSNYGLDTEKVKNAGKLIGDGLHYDLLKTEEKFNEVKFIYNKKDMVVTTDYLYRNDIEYPILGFDTEGDPLYWNFEENPHMGIFSKTGGGKSVSSRQIIYQLSKITDQLTMVDFKRVELGPLSMFGYDVITSLEDGFMDRLREFHKDMENQNKTIEEKGKVNFREAGLKPAFMVFDEFASLSDAFSDDKEGKAERKEFYRIVGDIARRGRSIGYYLMIITQRPDTTILPGEIRNNISQNMVMRAGDNTTRQMAFNDTMSDQRPLPKGYALANDDNDEVQTIRIPMYDADTFYKDMDKDAFN